MPTLSGQDIYRNFAQARGTASWQAAQTAARRLAAEMAAQAEELGHISAALESAWSGTASVAAVGGADRLAGEYTTAATALDVTQDVLERQVESWHTAANNVVPVPAPPAQANPVQGLADGDPTHQRRWLDSMDAAGRNVAVYEDYQQASQEQRTRLPAGYGSSLAHPGDPGPASGRRALAPVNWAPPESADDSTPAGQLPRGVSASARPAGTDDVELGKAAPSRRGGFVRAGRASMAVPGTRMATAARRAQPARRRSGSAPSRESAPDEAPTSYLTDGDGGAFGVGDRVPPPVLGGQPPAEDW